MTLINTGNFGSFEPTTTVPILKNVVEKITSTYKESFETVTFKTFLPGAFLSKWEQNDKTQALINLIDKLYYMDDFINISRFLKQNQFLLPVLLDAYKQITNIFKGGYVLELRLKDYYDDLDGPKLYLLVIYDSEDENAYEYLDELDNAWWISNASTAKFKMNIDLEFR